MPLGHSLQGAPRFYNEYAENLLKKLEQAYEVPYQSFRNVSREKNEANRREIERLISLQKGNKFDIIPFSISGSSKPIAISPYALSKIINNEEFARKVYESATGYSNISRDEVEDLRKRATQQYESSLPDIKQLGLENRPPLEQQVGNIPPEISNLKLQVRELSGKNEKNTERKKKLKEDIRKLSQRSEPILSNIKPIDFRLGQLNPQKENLERQIDLIRLDPYKSKNFSEILKMNKYKEALEKVNSEKNLLESKLKPFRSELDLISSEKQNLESQVNESDVVNKENFERKRILEEEIKKLSQKRHSSAAAAAEVEPINEPQYGEFPAAEGSDPEDIIKRASIEREISTLLGPQGRIASRNPTYGRAKSILERGIDDDSMELAKDELIESKKHDELKAVEPYVKASLEDPSDEYMNKYVDDYTKDIRKAIQDESEEEFLKKIAPKINMSFAQMGAFHSGARNKALKDAASEHRLKLQRELAHLTGSARDKGMEHHELKKRREQSAGHLMGHTTKSQREASQRQAELLRQQAVTKQAVTHMNASALGQVAKEEHAHEQHEIDAEAKEFEQQKLYKQNQLERQLAMASGVAPTNIQTITGESNPSPEPANYYNLGGAGLAAAASAFGQPIKSAKEGGSIRKKYADGGSIGSDDIRNEIRNIIQEQNKAGQSHLEEISNQNPMQNWLRHVGKEMLSNPREDPLLNLGRGTSASMDHRDMMRERAANLYDKIQSTKLNQYKVLAEYENMKDKLAFNREQLGETRRGHDIMREISLERQNTVHNNPKKSSADKKMEDKALENIMENHEMKNDLILMDDALKKSTLGTGPWLGRGKSFLGIDNEIDVLGNHIVTKANKLYGRGGGSNLQLKTLQGGKPGQTLSKKANETIIKKYGQESDRRINKNVAYLIKSGWTPEEISQATGIGMPDGAPENAHNSNMESAQLSEGQNDPFAAWRPQE